MPVPITTKPLAIAAGDSLSSVGYVGMGDLIAIDMPAAWTAAPLTFQESHDGTTFLNVYKSDGTELSIMAAANQSVRVGPLAFAPWIKIRSGPAAAPVVQSNLPSAVLTIVVRKLPISSVR